jgi:glucose/arabinose dehydrogenase
MGPMGRIVVVVAAASSLVATETPAGSLSGPVSDAGRTAELVDLIQFPATSVSLPLARIEFVREVPDGSGRLFANDMRGPFYAIDQGTLSVYLDMSVLRPGLVSDNLGTGFISFAFHPDFATNGLFYTVHTEEAGTSQPNLEPALPVTALHHAVLTEWQTSDPAANTFSGDSRELIRIPAPHAYHNLGEIGFDPGLVSGDPGYGLLYIAAGDFGSVVRGDFDQLQRLDTPYGCILRIDPTGAPFERNGVTYPYAIPLANPHAGTPGVLGEIYAHGFRNPQNFHFDRGGLGTLFVMDIGQGNLEEVNLVGAGRNYGWPVREGTFALDPVVDTETVLPLPAGDDSLGFTYPVAQYDHEEGSAIAGGLAVRTGPASALRGAFVFGDIVTGRMFHADVDSMILADDGDPATTAPIYELTLLREGQPTNLLAVVRAATGSLLPWRTDLRLHADLSGRLLVSTKQDGYLRELIPTPLDPTSTSPHRDILESWSVSPNPFNPRTAFWFVLSAEVEVRLRLHDTRGRRVRTLVDGPLPQGPHRFEWDGRDDHGRTVASGVYLYELRAGKRTARGKLSLVR